VVTAKERLTRSWGLHDAIEFLSELHYDVSPLGNEEIFQLLEEVLDGLDGDEGPDHTL
jgi:2',3'-cyclic-nucleotide 2'-phosphodiesterase (5'-nucleotidase family)